VGQPNGVADADPVHPGAVGGADVGDLEGVGQEPDDRVAPGHLGVLLERLNRVAPERGVVDHLEPQSLRGTLGEHEGGHRPDRRPPARVQSTPEAVLGR
jgi:hypothetical protein